MQDSPAGSHWRALGPWLLAGILAAAVGSAGWAQAQEPLTLYYFPRPPFYTTDAQGQAGGPLVDLARAIMTRADLAHRWVSMPSKRVLLQLGQGDPACGVGWIRTPERETFARFSRPILRDAPMVALARPATAQGLPTPATLAGLLTSDLVLGVIDGFSYGPEVDALIARHHPPRQPMTGEVSRLMYMTAAGRCDWMLLNRQEALWQMANDPALGRGLRALELADAPPGNLRRLMCAKSLAAATMERIDRAILLVLGDDLSEASAPADGPPDQRSGR